MRGGLEFAGGGIGRALGSRRKPEEASSGGKAWEGMGTSKRSANYLSIPKVAVAFRFARIVVSFRRHMPESHYDFVATLTDTTTAPSHSQPKITKH